MATTGVPYPYNYREISSLATLLSMTLVAIYALYDFYYRRDLPWWTLGTFVFTIIGGGGGFLWELFGNLNWRAAETVECFRRANVGLVMGASVLTSLRVSLNDWDDFYTGFITALASFLFFESLTNIPNPAHKGLPQGGGARTFTVLTIHHLVELFVLASAAHHGTHQPIRGYAFLIAGNVINWISFTPPSIAKSAIFHGLNTVVAFLTYEGLKSFSTLPGTPAINCSFAWIGAVVGFALMSTNSVLRNQIRFWANNNFWQGIYGGLMSTSMPSPQPPQFVNGKEINCVEYYRNHPRSRPLTVLSATEVPLNQRFPVIYKKVNGVFKFIGLLDWLFPQGNVNVLPSDKPRIDPARPVEFYVPQIILEEGTETRFEAPLTLKEWDKNKQAIAWTTLFGHTSSMLKQLPKEQKDKQPILKDCTHLIDLHWLRKYKAKPGYYNYGGRAYFKYNETNHHLSLEVITDFNDVSDEDLISVHDVVRQEDVEYSIRSFLSSSGIVNVAGAHLAGIHMFFNLVSLSLYNAFDIVNPQPSHPHPFRAAMNIHFYNHVLVNEKTTAHLMDNGGVFNQIFALDHDSVCGFVGDFFNNVVYGNGADIEARAAVFNSDPLNLPKHYQIHWQKRYKDIFHEYATKLVDHIWPSDKHLENDKDMPRFYKALNELYVRRSAENPDNLPDRYGSLRTKRGVVAFIEDSIFTVTVLHEVFGTTVPSYATDSKILPSQIPKDLRPNALEDYTSLILVTAATSRVRFPRLLEQDHITPFSTLAGNLPSELSENFNHLKRRLQELAVEWTSNAEELFINDEYQRVLPSALEIAAGY